MKKVIIIGSGVAGLTAAIYSARSNLNPLVISGITQGGQLTITTDVENFPGFPNGIMGPDLMNDMKLQAEKFGAEYLNANVKKVDFSKAPFTIFTEDEEYQSQCVIIATGAEAKFLGLDSEKRFVGKGVSACATCDAFFYRGKEVMVVGGGDTALEEALFLTKFASKVSIIHRRDKLRGSIIMQEKAMQNDKINFIWDSTVEDIIGTDTDGVTGIKLSNIKTKEITHINCHGVFIAIGHSPNSDIFSKQIGMDKGRYIITKNGTETNIKGVFAAGDVQDPRYRQAITAAGTGCMAAMDAEKFLTEFFVL